MGLVFPIAPDLRKSTPERLSLSSSKRRFSMGGSFLFIGLLLGTMYLAASPLFKLFWTQGGLLDRMITLGVVVPMILYPLFTVACWFFQERADLTRRADGLYDFKAWNQLFGVRWQYREAQGVKLADFVELNWMGARNMASLEAEQRGAQSRYATRGHWMLKLKTSDRTLHVERRAKKEEIDFLKAQIEAYFA